ncbi:MAG: hypothetical protein ACLTSZ_08960 [Lachnospiraceae bacterium]
MRIRRCASWLVTEDVPLTASRYRRRFPAITAFVGSGSSGAGVRKYDAAWTRLQEVPGHADKMPLKEDAKSACTELGVKASRRSALGDLR